jgi:histone H3
MTPGRLRYRSSVVKLKHTTKFRKSSVLILPKQTFRRICDEITDAKVSECHLGSDAVDALQHASEAFLVGLFQDANLCAMHGKRQTVRVQDVRLCRLIRGRDYAGGAGAGLGLDGCEGSKIAYDA